MGVEGEGAAGGDSSAAVGAEAASERGQQGGLDPGEFKNPSKTQPRSLVGYRSFHFQNSDPCFSEKTQKCDLSQAGGQEKKGNIYVFPTPGTPQPLVLSEVTLLTIFDDLISLFLSDPR